MKKLICAFLVLMGCQKSEPALKKVPLLTEEQKLGYVIGVDIGDRLKRQPHKIDFYAVLRGIEETYLNETRAIGDDSILALQTRFQKQADAYERTIQERRRLGLEFMERNGKQKGIVTLENGLQYEVLSGSSGSNHPSDSSTVKCNLVGALLDGTILEDSKQEGGPRILKVKNSIMGIRTVLRLMSPGQKVRVWVPSPLAFGRNGNGAKIPEYATLVYEVELLAILE